MKRLMFLGIVVTLLCLFGCIDIGILTVEIDSDRPPFVVTMTYNGDIPHDGGIFKWIGPWGQEVTVVPSFEIPVERVNANPIRFAVEWTDGEEVIDPDPVFIALDNDAPIIARRPTFTTTTRYGPIGRGIDILRLEAHQMYVVDLRRCTIDPDGDEVKVTNLEVETFHEDGFVAPQFDPVYPVIEQLYEGGDFEEEKENALFFTPPGSVQWGGIEGRFGWSPRFWLKLHDVNGLPYAPFDIGPAYTTDALGCVDLFEDDLPTGGAVLRAEFSDGMGGIVEAEWLYIVGPVSCN